jgi:hypothetical protein
VQQLRIYEGNTLRAGLSHTHGLRHAYAQQRYEELTGWKAPTASGPKAKTLTPEQRETDRQARLTISRELGHEREQITAAYWVGDISTALTESVGPKWARELPFRAHPMRRLCGVPGPQQSAN